MANNPTGWGSSLYRAISYVLPVDEEVEKARKRDELRILGNGLRAQKEELLGKLETERRIYREMLILSKGDKRSGFAKQAMDAKKKMDAYATQIGGLDARIAPLETLLRSAAVRTEDAKFYALMKDVATSSTNSNAPSPDQMAQMMQVAARVVNENLSIDDDLTRLSFNPVTNNAAEDAAFAADYENALKQTYLPPTESSASSADDHTEIAAELIAHQMRNGTINKSPFSIKPILHYLLPWEAVNSCIFL